MIRITAELIPGGDAKSPRRRVLGTIDIANDGSGDGEIGNYDGTLHAEYTGPNGRPGRITGFRRQRQSVWTLVGAFLKKWNHAK
jgi:hypothetical protein